MGNETPIVGELGREEDEVRLGTVVVDVREVLVDLGLLQAGRCRGFADLQSERP